MSDDVTFVALRKGSDRELRVLARQLERRLDVLQAAAGHDPVGARVDTRLERLERYIRGMSPGQRLRLAAALHLLSPRLDGDLATPDCRS
jgi:hypothetical protein